MSGGQMAIPNFAMGDIFYALSPLALPRLLYDFDDTATMPSAEDLVLDDDPFVLLPDDLQPIRHVIKYTPNRSGNLGHGD